MSAFLHFDEGVESLQLDEARDRWYLSSFSTFSTCFTTVFNKDVISRKADFTSGFFFFLHIRMHCMFPTLASSTNSCLFVSSSEYFIWINGTTSWFQVQQSPILFTITSTATTINWMRTMNMIKRLPVSCWKQLTHVHIREIILQRLMTTVRYRVIFRFRRATCSKNDSVPVVVV